MKNRYLIFFLTVFLLISVAVGMFVKLNDEEPQAKFEQNDDERVAKQESDGIDYLILVNKENKLSDDWLKKIMLFADVSIHGNIIMTEIVTLNMFYELQAAVLEDGVGIELDNAYYSLEYQNILVKRYEELYGKENAAKYIAMPGYSEHNTGLAIDICLNINGKIVDDCEQMLKETKAFERIHQKLADYGFILRYPKGKENVTGYSYKPWHLRYVGDVNIAKEIQSKNLTLEEFLKKK